MLGIILVLLIIFYFLGYIHLPGLIIPDIVLFNINNHPITLWNLLILGVISWAIGVLPSPFQEIAGVLLIIWILSVLGIIAFVALPHIIIVAIIIGLVIAVFSGL